MSKAGVNRRTGLVVSLLLLLSLFAWLTFQRSDSDLRPSSKVEGREESPPFTEAPAVPPLSMRGSNDENSAAQEDRPKSSRTEPSADEIHQAKRKQHREELRRTVQSFYWEGGGVEGSTEAQLHRDLSNLFRHVVLPHERDLHRAVDEIKGHVVNTNDDATHNHTELMGRLEGLFVLLARNLTGQRAEDADCMMHLTPQQRGMCLLYAAMDEPQGGSEERPLFERRVFLESYCSAMVPCLLWGRGRFSQRLTPELLERVYEERVVRSVVANEARASAARSIVRNFVHSDENTEENRWLWRRTSAMEEFLAHHADLLQDELLLISNATRGAKFPTRACSNTTALRDVFQGRFVGYDFDRRCLVTEPLPKAPLTEEEMDAVPRGEEPPPLEQLLALPHMSPMEVLSVLHQNVVRHRRRISSSVVSSSEELSDPEQPVKNSQEQSSASFQSLIVFSGDSMVRQLLTRLIHRIRSGRRRGSSSGTVDGNEGSDEEEEEVEEQDRDQDRGHSYDPSQHYDVLYTVRERGDSILFFHSKNSNPQTRKTLANYVRLQQRGQKPQGGGTLSTSTTTTTTTTAPSRKKQRRNDKNEDSVTIAFQRDEEAQLGPILLQMAMIWDPFTKTSRCESSISDENLAPAVDAFAPAIVNSSQTYLLQHLLGNFKRPNHQDGGPTGLSRSRSLAGINASSDSIEQQQQRLLVPLLLPRTPRQNAASTSHAKLAGDPTASRRRYSSSSSSFRKVQCSPSSSLRANGLIKVPLHIEGHVFWELVYHPRKLQRIFAMATATTTTSRRAENKDEGQGEAAMGAQEKKQKEGRRSDRFRVLNEEADATDYLVMTPSYQDMLHPAWYHSDPCNRAALQRHWPPQWNNSVDSVLALNRTTPTTTNRMTARSQMNHDVQFPRVSPLVNFSSITSRSRANFPKSLLQFLWFDELRRTRRKQTDPFSYLSSVGLLDIAKLNFLRVSQGDDRHFACRQQQIKTRDHFGKSFETDQISTLLFKSSEVPISQWQLFRQRNKGSWDEKEEGSTDAQQQQHKLRHRRAIRMLFQLLVSSEAMQDDLWSISGLYAAGNPAVDSAESAGGAESVRTVGEARTGVVLAEQQEVAAAPSPVPRLKRKSIATSVPKYPEHVFEVDRRKWYGLLNFDDWNGCHDQGNLILSTVLLLHLVETMERGG